MNNSIFKSKTNKELITNIVADVVHKKYNVVLNNDFQRILGDIMEYILLNFGNKPKNITSDKHLNNLNKKCIAESIKYVCDNESYFTKNEPKIYKSTNNIIKHKPIEHQMVQSQIQPNSEQAYASILEQRRLDFPAMNNPSYQTNQNANITEPSANISNVLTSILVQTPVAMQNPSMVPNIVGEILQIQHLVDLYSQDPNAFHRQVTDAKFLQMIISQINNKNDPNMKPMNLIDDIQTNYPTSNISPEVTTNNGQINTVTDDFTKLLNIYNQTDISSTDRSPADISPAGISPADQLVSNVLPDLDQVHLIDYCLCLDFRSDLDITNTYKSHYPLKFVKYGNISKVELSACLLPESDFLIQEPYIFVKIKELGGRCFTSNHDLTFGKLILIDNKNGYLHYAPEHGTCVQTFSQPITLQNITLNFLNFNGKSINLNEISIQKSFRLKKQNKIKFISQYRHKLTKNDIIKIHIYCKTEIDEYEVSVDEIIDDITFTVDNIFDRLTEHIVILRPIINGSFQFKLYEINWDLLTKKNIKNAQLIKLSKLVSDRRNEVEDITTKYEDIK